MARGPKPKPLAARIEQLSIPEPMSGCWIWLAGERKGYGAISINNKTVGAHRASWVALRSDIPNGMLVCHRCDNRLCVNPDHLFLGTPQCNSDDMKKKKRHRCPTGQQRRNAKLTPAAVLEIRSSTTGRRVLAKKFGVHHCYIDAIRRGEGWSECNPTSNQPLSEITRAI